MFWLKVPVASICLFALFIGTFAQLNENEDYCTIKECGYKHVACNNPGDFGPKCPDNVRVVNMEPFKEHIVRLHNEKRNEIAGGKAKFEPALRMGEMRWDDELAALALLNVKKCKLKNDKCRATRRFRYTGQNIALYSYSGDEETKQDHDIIQKRITKWFNEAEKVSMNDVKRYPAGSNAGHFLVVINERNTHVGCAAVRYRNQNDGDLEC